MFNPMNNTPLFGVPQDYHFLRRADDQQLFIAPKVSARPNQKPPSVVLTPVEIGYVANNQYFSLQNVPQDAPARRLEVLT